MATSINIKLVDRSEYEMMIARVLKRDLPHGTKKHFFLNLCRLVISPDMNDSETMRRILRVVEEGASSVLLASTSSETQLRKTDPNQPKRTHQSVETESDKSPPSSSSSLGNSLGSMFGS